MTTQKLPGPFTAWQLIGWEGPHGLLRKVGGRTLFCIMNHNCETMRSDNVLAVPPVGYGAVQYLDPDTMMEIDSITEDGYEFLEEQNLIK